MADEPKTTEEDPITAYEAFLATLDPAVRTELESHTVNLKNALVSERGLSKTGKEAAKKLQLFEEAEAKRKQDELSELERVTAAKTTAEQKAAKLQAALDKERIDNKILAVAAKMLFADPDDAVLMIDRSSLVIGEDGKVTGAEEAVKALAKAKPHLLGDATQQQYNLNSGDKGGTTQSAIQETVLAKKRARYGSGI